MPAFAATARERTQAALARIAQENDESRIFTALDPAQAMAAAEASAARAAAGTSLGPLDGALVAVKDNLAVRGLLWTAGIGAFRTRIAQDDAAVVARLRQAGAVILGTLNMHEGALGATNDNPHFGRCQNPLRAGYTPGGSSGGSGAAVAAGLVDLALGTDTMGSVRIPAAYCGVFGLKVTDGTLDRSGLAFLSPSLDSIGPLSADPTLLLAAYDVMAGSTSAPAPAHRRLAVPRQLADLGCEDAVRAALDITVSRLRAAGVEVETVDFAGWEPSRARRGGLLLIEAEAAQEMPAFITPGMEGVSAGFQSLLAYGAGLSAPRLVEALSRMKQVADLCRRLLVAYDGLLLPTAPQRAFPFDGPVPHDQADFTCLANFSGAPAVAMPVRLASESLPASVQVIGRPFSEGMLCALASSVVGA